MKIKLENGTTADIDVDELTAGIHDYSGRLSEYDPQDLMEPGQEEPYGDFRLQVYPDGSWEIHTGASDFDQDHRGCWAAALIPVGMSVEEAHTQAQDLIEGIDW